MKIKTLVLALTTLLAFTLSLSAADKKPVEKRIAGPNGGRVLTKIDPQAEFLITTERKVQITFLDGGGKAIAPAAQVVTVTTGARSAPAKLTFAQSGNVLISTTALPAGNDLPAVVQIKVTPDAKAVTEKFTVDLSKCGDCGKAEYACTCAH